MKSPNEIFWKGNLMFPNKHLIRVFFSHYLLQCRWILRHLRSLCLVRSVRQRKHHHIEWYSCLRNPKDRGAWQATVHGVAKSWTWLGNRVHTPTLWDIYIYIDLNIELKALKFVEIEGRMVVSRTWGNWEDVGQRVQLEVKNRIKTYAYQLEKDAEGEGDCIYVKYRV